MRDGAEFDLDEQRFLYRIARALLAEGAYGELLASLLDCAIQGFGADRGFVLVRDAGRFRAAIARNFRSQALEQAEQEVSESIAGAVVTHRRALLVDNASDAEQFRNSGSVRRLGLRSVLCAPVIAADEAFALLYLENRDIAHRFTERQRELLDEICGLAAPRLRVALALERADRRAAADEASGGDTDGILTADPAMLAVLRTVRQVASTDLPVLIQGETGTGKELVARAVYRHSTRTRSSLVVLNCAAIPAGLIESELFGYVRGAFTSASRDHMGLIATAHRGTLFLDEIGDLPLELQPRLLRVLQSGEFKRLGAVREETVDVRVVAATNRDLHREVEEGRFRSDLYFRLSPITIEIPPLRERRGDMELLASHFLRAYATRYGREPSRLEDDALAMLTRYSFPGNVRELQGEMARLVAVTSPDAPIGKDMLNARIRAAVLDAPLPRTTSANALATMSLQSMEKRLIQSVLESTGGNKTRAADVLGISREGLRTKMQRLGLSDSTAAAQDE